MEETLLSGFIEEKIKTSSETLPKPIIFLEDPYELTDGLDKDLLRIFEKEYRAVRYTSDFHIRGEIEKYKDDRTRKFLIITSKLQNNLIKDYTGWRSNNVSLTPESLLEHETGMEWCESINIIGNKLLQHEKEVVEYRLKTDKKVLLPSDARAIIVSALTKNSFIHELTPSEAYLFLSRNNQYKKLVNQIPELKDYTEKRLEEAITFIAPILKSDQLYRSFPDYLWLFYIIRKLGRDPSNYMRGISPGLSDRFNRLKIPPEALQHLAEELQKEDLAICKKQVSQMEEKLLNEKPEAQSQFMNLVEPQSDDPLSYYMKIAERDKYTRLGIESLFEKIPDRIVSRPYEGDDDRVTQLINDLQQHWLIQRYTDHIRLLKDLRRFNLYQQKINDTDQADELNPDEWIKIYTQQIVPLEDASSSIGINPQLRLLSRENRDKLRKRYQECIWFYNTHFQRFIAKKYPEWIQKKDRPLLTADFLEKIFKKHHPLQKYKEIYLIVIDCMRANIWNKLKKKLLEQFELLDEQYLLSLIPSTTIFSRTSIFAGDLPKKCVRIPERGRPRHRYGDEKRTLAHALEISPEEIDFISKTESAIKIDEIDQVLSSPKKLKVIVLDSIDNRIHKAGADDRLGMLEQEFLDIYETVIKSILKELGDKERTILFITSDHGFVNTNKVKVIEREKAFVNPRYADLNPLHTIDDKRAFTISGKKLGLTDRRRGKRYAFPSGNLSFKLARENITVRTPIREETVYSHGGVTLQEMVVPSAVMVPRKKQSPSPIQILLKHSDCMEEESSTLVFEAVNPNYIPMTQISIQSSISAPTFLPRIEPKKSQEFKIIFTPKNHGDLEVELEINYRLRGAFQEAIKKIPIMVERNPEIVERPIDKFFEK